MIAVEHSSFNTTETGPAPLGLVDATIFGITKTVPARRLVDGTIHVYGVEGRYTNGRKWWRAVITSRQDGSIEIMFGRDDRNPKFSKSDIRFKAA
jgi:hypothetical protein